MTDGATDRDLSGSLATVRRFAALSGPFRPSTALEVAAVSTRVVRALVASGLAEACQTGLGPDGTFWLMRGSERQRQLAPLDEAGLSREAAWRRTVAPLDEDAEELLEVLTGSGRYAADVLGPRLSEVVGRVTEADRPWLERASDVLTWAGGSTAVPDSLDLVRAALARLDDARRGAEVTQRPFVGREEDVTALADWLGRPAAGPPVTALFVSGLPGVGKSTLLDRALAAVYPGEGKPFVIRLDFDRPSLDILDQAGLTGEVGRQIGNQLPQAAADLKRLRSEAARTDRGVPVKGERPDGPDDALLSYCGALVRGENCPVVVVLDTLEVLRGRGESHPGKLFAWLDGCMAHGLAPLCVIAAGRGDALDPIPDRVGRRHDLSNLSLEASERVLAQFTVPHSARPAIHSLARGNPLLLRVAAQLETDPAAGSAGTISSSLVGDAYLHRFLLSRLDSPLLRALAQPGLVPRWISPVLLREVIAPTVGAAIPSLEEAERLVAELERQAWLVRRQPGTEWLRQDAGMRVVLLPLLYADDPESCARLDRAAAAWFERRPETLWRAEGLYHRLQATRVGDPLPAVPSELSSLFDASTLAELPEAAREAVARSRGERSPPFRTAGLAMAESVDLRAVDDLRLMIEKSDWTEASLVYDQAIRRRSLDPASPAADPVRSFLWRVGRWSEARRSLRSRDAVAPDDRDLPGLHPIDALARLEMRAEFTPLGLMRQFGGGRASAPPSGSLSSDALGFVLSGSAGGDLRSGALGFVLAVAAPKLAARSSLSDETDSVQAALALWARGPKRVLTQALQVAGDRRAAWGLPRPPMLDPEPLGPGQSRPAPSGPLPDGLRSDDLVRITGALAALTPYAGPMRQILRLNQDGRLAEHAAAVLERLRDLGPPFVEYPERTGPGDAFMALQALGLAAEWAHAAGVVLENQDLRLIARRAELWRRTVAGRWSYFVPRPKRWSDFEDWHIAELLYDPWLWSAFRNWSRLDATATLQLYQLQSHADRETASRHLLLPWTGERVDGNLSVFAPTDAEIFDRNRGPRPPLETASLLRRRLPSAFAMPAAILASVRSDRGRPSAARSGPALADRVLPSPPPTDPQRNFAMAANRTPSSPPMPRGRGHAESLERLQQNLLKPGGIGEAAAKVIQADPGDLDRFGVTQEQVLNAMGQRGQALEAAIPPAALEAIIRRAGRPPLLIRNDAVVLAPLPGFPGDIDARIRAVESSIPSVGRVEFVNHGTAWGGTGWVVEQRGTASIVATNRHVAKLVARRARDGSGVFLRSPVTGVRYGARVDFNEEVGAPPDAARTVEVSEVAYLADDFSADIALLTVSAPSGAFRMPDPLVLAAREAAREEIVALIGYPAYDDRHDGSSAAIAALSNYFRDLYEVKRFAPGFLTRAFTEGVISHDCTSLGGNSGSPLISLEQQAVVGLHFAGLYGVENSAVSVTTLKSLLKGETVVAVSRPAEVAGTEKADGVHTKNDLANRDGYDPTFLGKKLPVPWPVLSDAIQADLATPSDATDDRPHELRYTHFGIKFSAARKLPAVTAVNVDGAKAVKIKRGDDQWFYDLRIPRELQHGSKSYRDKQIDRGHMVRREDPNWGRMAEQANFDTFHFTNSAPQHSELNQGKALWQGLENYILDSARTYGFKACIFTGPVFGEDDPELDEGIRVPLEFWKIVAMVDADRQRLHATGYILSQGQLIRKLLEDRRRTEAVEGFVLSGYRTFQVALSDLGSALGYDFGPLVAADPLTRTAAGRESIARQQPVVIELTDGSDLIL